MADDLKSYEEFEEYDELPYMPEDQINFAIVTMGLKHLPFFRDDTYLGMQAMNVGVVEVVPKN